MDGWITGPGLLGSGFTDPGCQYCQQIQNLCISGLWYVAAIICQDWLLDLFRNSSVPFKEGLKSF